jgi:hypothetical protein
MFVTTLHPDASADFPRLRPSMALGCVSVCLGTH